MKTHWRVDQFRPNENKTVHVKSATIDGIDGVLVDVAVHVHDGTTFLDDPCTSGALNGKGMVRIERALRSIGHSLEGCSFLTSVSPSVHTTWSSLLDLPIALGVLACQGAIPEESLANRIFIGELSMDGVVCVSPGVFPIIIAAGKEDNCSEIVVPFGNFNEAAINGKQQCIPVRSLKEMVAWLKQEAEIQHVSPRSFPCQSRHPNMADVPGQDQVKRALEVAAAGHFSVLMIGPKGSGKTKLSRRLGTIMPIMKKHEAIEVTKIFSVAGLLGKNAKLIEQRPFRAQCHATSRSALVGTDVIPRPSEITLAHNGVLFLENLPMWQKSTLLGLKPVLRTRKARGRSTDKADGFPRDFILVGSMNYCPCGFLGNPRHQCSCSPLEVTRYRKKVRQYADWFDIHVEIPTAPFIDFEKNTNSETSEIIRSRVVTAVETKRARQSSTAIPDPFVRLSSLPADLKCLVDDATIRLGLTKHSVDVILRVARTVADLDRSDHIGVAHFSEAIGYRLISSRAHLTLGCFPSLEKLSVQTSC